MEPTKNEQNWLKRNAKKAKYRAKNYFRRKERPEHSKTSSRTENPCSVMDPTNPDNGNPSNMSQSSPAVHIEDSEVGIEAPTGNISGSISEELLGPDKLWTKAYEMVGQEDPKLLEAYNQLLLGEGYLGQTDSNEPRPADRDWQEQVQRLAREKLEATQKQRLSFQVRGEDVVIRDQLQKIIGFIISTKDVVATAISSEPFAALGWAGVMFVFPFLNTMLQQDKDAIEGFECILPLLVRCKLIADDFLQPTSADLNPPKSYHNAVLSLQSKIVELYYNVYKYQISILVHYNLSALGRYWGDLKVKDDWKGTANRFKATEEEIRGDTQALSSHKTTMIDRRLECFLSKSKQLLEAFNRAIESIKEIEQASHLGHLRVAHSAAFESSDAGRQPCTPGTQSEILSRLQNWIENSTKPILWLHGMAGTGKSTIAQTVAASLSKKTSFSGDSQLLGNIYLGATFFFKQDDNNRNHAGVLFTTLAHQLAHKPLGLENEIANAIKQHASPDISSRDLKTQWEELILKPLKTIEDSSPQIRLILIIDALDECWHKEPGIMKRNVRDIVHSLTRVGELSGIQVRVLITSRNQSHIHAAFESIQESHEELELPKIILDKSSNDITTFFKSNLHNNWEYNGVSSDRLSPEDFRQLVEKTGGLFIYAATACKFLNIANTDIANKRLRKLLEGTYNTKSLESNLDNIYRAVLDFNTQDLDEVEKQEEFLLKEILRLIVVLFRPLPIDSLAEFTIPKKPVSSVEKCLRDIGSIVDVPKERKSPISLVHLSFREFLLDKHRCGRTGFFVEPSMVHFHLLERCLDIMSQHLHMDMCDIRKPGVLSIEIPPDLVQRSIEPHLQYACKYWVNHLLQIEETQLPKDILVDDGIIHKFLQKHILNWVETLSLIGEAGSAIHTINHLKTLVNTSESRELSNFLYDIYRFIMSNIHIIREAPLQVYYSPVLFSPSTSIIRRLFLKPLTEWVTKLPTVDDTWGAELLAIKHASSVWSVMISQNGKTMVTRSGSMAQLWDATTGTEIAKIGYSLSEIILSVSISSDGQTIALGLTSGIIRLYDVRTSETLDMLGHEGNVFSVAFSLWPNSKLLASVSDDGACFVWDVSTQKHAFANKVPESYRQKIAISPDGNLVAVGSCDYYHNDKGVIKVWNISTGELAANFNYAAMIESIAFSSDGVTMALAMGNGSVEIHNTKSWFTPIDIFHEGYAKSVVFSPDGNILAIGYDIGVIYLHNSVSGEEIRKLTYGKGLCDMAFFPSGETLAIASYDRTVRLLDITIKDDTKRKARAPQLRYYYEIAVIHVSNTAMVASNGQTIVWDMEKCKIKIEIPHQLQCSPNDKFAVSSPYSSYQALWDIATGELLRHFKDAKSIHFSPYGDILALSLYDAIQILEIGTWQERAHFKFENNHSPKVIQFSADSKVILWTTHGDPSEVPYLHLRILEMPDFSYSTEYDAGAKPRLSPDGALVAFRPKGASCVYLLQINTQEVRASLPFDDKYIHILFSPDSTRIITFEKYGFECAIWDTAKGNLIHTLRMTDKIRPISIALDGKVLLGTSAGASIWDPRTDEVTKLPINQYDFALSFAEDNKYLVSSRGRLPVPSTARDFSCLYVNDEWVLQGGERLLWLPAAYRAGSAATSVRGGTIILAPRVDSVKVIEIDLENTPIAKQHKGSLQVEQGDIRVTEVE
ncbi:WD40 repeat-like protein [Daldinia vernicosa]|uniref:WD40 repeat-like protein n=1 Tax=Daldinia vernicosa TaxID=114800 RepID=UPI0020073EEC|nr:WD40 repeat-like protein [Daldinia vernicosa]KAI0854201.1 WD40 repeat-like protein [Daldinia vernicosa]